MLGSMPIFMDKHEITDATPEEVSHAHYEDLRHESKYHCRCFTYWYDRARGHAFCLIEAPSAEDVKRLHEESHGLVPHQIIEVNPEQVGQFLGRVTDPESAKSEPIEESAFRVLMFTDMADSTDITHRLGDDAAYEVFRTHREIILGALDAHRGREVNQAGDGFLASFASVTQAVACAIEIQRALAARNSREDVETPIRVRIGLGAGEPVADGDGLFGSTVNLISRICDRAQPEEILASSAIRQLCTGKGFDFESRGEATLKGFDEPVALDAIRWRPTDP